MSWENTFQSWSVGPGTAEQERCDNAVRMITDALKEDSELQKFDVSVFPQGSYRASTNIKQDSDVDICIMLKDTFFVDYPVGITDERAGNSGSGYHYSDFKNSVESALVRKFGREQVARGKKAFDIHANSYRVDADVIPTFEYRWYTEKTDYTGKLLYHSGVKLITDDGHHIINWPEQTYQNGVGKNTDTGRTYKRIIRILKRLRNDMQENGISAADDIASFLIESLVWNTPNDVFNRQTYTDVVTGVLAHTFNGTRKQEDCREWGEVNELKHLFRSQQPWTLVQANNFLDAAWDYVGL